MKYFAAWLFVTLLGGYLGAEWALKDVPPGESGVGDGIGVLLYGTIGAFYGAIIGLVLVLVFLLIGRLATGRDKQ